jgi:hypothetical protein
MYYLVQVIIQILNHPINYKVYVVISNRSIWQFNVFVW